MNRDIHTRPQALDPGVIAFFALILGAFGMGASPIFVRFAEVGPLTSAFWRVFLALPALWFWARYDRLADRRTASNPQPVVDRGANKAIAIAGMMFAGDLIFWHLAIVKTSVANATFLATLAPVWVVLGSRLLIGEQVERRVLAGLALGLAGMACLIGGTITLKPENLTGDLFGVVTSFFFGAYFLAVRRARRTFGSGQTLFLSSVVTTAVLFTFAIALEDMIWPLTAYGVAALAALALISHAGGQGLLSFALGYLPAAFSALVIFVEGVAAAALGWLILDEAIGLTQFLGALSIFAGIIFARPRSTR